MPLSWKPRSKPMVLDEKAAEAFERGGVGHDQGSAAAAPKPEPKAAQSESTEPLKRLSVDMPAPLHRRFKTVCSATDRRMVAEVIAMIERRCAELEEEIQQNLNP